LTIFEIAQTSLTHFYNSFSPYLEQEKLNLDAFKYSTKPVFANFNSFSVVDNSVKIQGWGYLSNLDAVNSKTYLRLSSHGKNYDYLLNQALSMDLKKRYKDGENLGVAGFFGTINESELPEGDYKPSIIITNGDYMGERSFEQTYSIRYKKINKGEIRISRDNANLPRQIYFYNGWSSHLETSK
jgi:hypothetical protein